MAYSVYFTAAQANCGTQAVAKAYLEFLKTQYNKVGVFRGWANGPIEQDDKFLELLDVVGRRDEADLAWGTTREAYVKNEDAAMTELVKRYTDYADDFDAILILGVMDGDPINPGQVARNGRAIANLKTSVILVVPGAERTAAQVITVGSLSADVITSEHAPLSAIIIGEAEEGAQTAATALEAHAPVLVHYANTEPTIRDRDAEVLRAAMEHGSDVITPLNFQASLVSRARSNPQRIVLPESEDPRILKATDELLARGVANIILLGEEDKVRADAAELGLDISAAQIVSLNDEARVDKYATEFARLRAKKGVTYEQARETIKDVSYFGTMMVHMGDADGMVSGATHTTAHTIVPSFQIIKTKPGATLVSSCFLMLMEDRVYVYGDCAVTTNPTPEQLAGIALSSAETAIQFGVEPRVAMLSYSTGTSGKGADVDAVLEATELAHTAQPDLLIEGPIQYDAAVDPDVAKVKLPESPVAGKATVFVFPNLNAGNIGYKAVQRSSGAVAVGPVLQGLNKPVNDLSRGALVQDIVNTVAITAIQAQAQV
ncbi:phosphate acetyltransferase [Actinomycetaceae bacterium L2_0104]